VKPEQALYGEYQGVSGGNKHIFSCWLASLFRFFRPTHAFADGSATNPLRLAVAPTFPYARLLAGQHLDRSDTRVRFGTIRMMIRGELASGHESSRHNLVSGRSIETWAMMQSCASAAKLLGSAADLFSKAVSTPWPASGDRHLGSSSEPTMLCSSGSDSHAVRFMIPPPLRGIKPDNSCAT
jgi:hypothetical protein